MTEDPAAGRRSGTSVGDALQRDPLLVQRQAVEARAMLGGEAFEAGERALLLEHLRIGLQRERRVEDAGAAAAGLLLLDAVRGAVGAEEEFRRARGRRPAHRQPVPLALGDGQAISVRAEARRRRGRCG